jgi:signal transduction histidine kinase
MPEPVEIAGYFAVFEALTNTAKHARASAAEVEVAAGESVLRVRVSDDGCGGADFSRSSGLTGPKDRVEAFGGRISLHSPPGAGTALEKSSCPSTSRPGPSHRDLDAAVGMRITKTR